MNKLKITIVAMVAALGVIAIFPEVTLAAPADTIQGGVDAIGGGESQSFETSLKNIVNVLLFILGAIAVIMIIIGGVRYTTANGEASSIKAAKDTILYAVIGLIVASMAYAIVNFVVGAF